MWPWGCVLTSHLPPCRETQQPPLRTAGHVMQRAFYSEQREDLLYSSDPSHSDFHPPFNWKCQRKWSPYWKFRKILFSDLRLNFLLGQCGQPLLLLQTLPFLGFLVWHYALSVSLFLFFLPLKVSVPQNLVLSSAVLFSPLLSCFSFIFSYPFPLLFVLLPFPPLSSVHDFIHVCGLLSVV